MPFLVPIVLCCARAQAPAPVALLEQFPLRKGARWTYAGEARWSSPGRPVRSGPVRAVMEVLEVFHGGDAVAAVVRGFPMDLAGYRPGTGPGVSILVGRAGRFHQHTSRGLRPALAQARELLQATGDSSQPFLELPMAPGRSWGGDPAREDSLYRWVVDKEPHRFRAPGVAGGAPWQAWTASFHSLPEDLELEFAPGLGITGFSYDHHGSVGSVKVRLVAYRP